MANAFYTKMIELREREYRRGVQDGMRMGFDLVAIALNHEFGFGDTRIEKLETKVQALVNEIADTNDPDVTRAHINKALSQIRGDEFTKNRG